jgi:flagellar protein FlaG
MEIARMQRQSQPALMNISSKAEVMEQPVDNISSKNKPIISEEIPTRPIEGNEGGYIAELKQEFGNVNLDVKIRFEEDLKMMVVDILDKETKEVIKTIPPEYVIEMRKKMKEMTESGGKEGMTGFLVDFKI